MIVTSCNSKKSSIKTIAIATVKDRSSSLGDTSKSNHRQMPLISKECRTNQRFLSEDFSISCFTDYHLYGANSSLIKYNSKHATERGNIKIAEFNILHPGTSKTRFKDYDHIANIISKYDIVGLTELIPLMSNDKKINQSVVKFIRQAPRLINKTKKTIKELKYKLKNSKRGFAKNTKELELNKKKLIKLKSDLKRSYSIFKLPGYLQILKSLNKMSEKKEWKLILSPQAEGSQGTPTPELIGYYYRSNLIKPEENSYCKNRTRIASQKPLKKYSQLSSACIAKMDSSDFATSKAHVFSRRPFISSFKSGNFSFTLVTSHIIFDSPTELNTKEKILQSAFNVSDYEILGTGLNKNNYARFAETKVTLDFVQQVLINKFGIEDIIFMGDFNLNGSNRFWTEVLTSWENSKLFIYDKTSLTKFRFTGDSKETFGLSNNFDHFIFDPIKTSECLSHKGTLDGGSFNFLTGKFKDSIDAQRKIRLERRYARGTYARSINKYNSALSRYVDPYLKLVNFFEKISFRKSIELNQEKISTIGIVKDIRETREHGQKYKERVIDSQLFDDTYYQFYIETISDHLPIYMSCRTN